MDVDPGFIDLGVLPCTLDAGIAARAAIGLLVLATDQTMEHEFRHLVRLPGVAVYGARLFNDADITPETLRAIGDRIAPATELNLPSMHLDVVAFGCTSASMTLGEAEVFRQIRRVRPEVACTTPVTAAFAAFKALGARRIGVLTPYSPEVNAVVRAYLDAHGPAGRGIRDVRQARRSRGGTDLRGLDCWGDCALGARRAAGCGVRVVHQSEAGRDCGRDRGGGGHPGHLQRPRTGMAQSAAGGSDRPGAGRRTTVRVRVPGLVERPNVGRCRGWQRDGTAR